MLTLLSSPHSLLRVNPLRADPTRTTSLRRRFVARVKQRFTWLTRQVWDFVVTKNALDLPEKPPRKAHNRLADNDFIFYSDPQKLEAFNDWFKRQVENGVFIVPEGTPMDRPWVAEYVESAYKRGLLNAYFAAHTDQFPSMEAFMAAFAAPESMAKIRLLATRVFEELRGITSAMSTELSRILTQGLIDGQDMLTIAREMTRKIQGMTLQRALVMARTEIIRAHAEGQLDAFRKLGVEKLDIKAEYSTAGDDRVCPICEELEGRVYTLDEASGVIPQHPNCRCAWIPHVVVP